MSVDRLGSIEVSVTTEGDPGRESYQVELTGEVEEIDEEVGITSR